jgi:hypothetical protein
LGLWYHYTQCDSYGLYIQIENAFERGIKAVIKTGKVANLHALYGELNECAQKYGVPLAKPAYLRRGATSTVAIIENVFSQDFNHCIAELKRVETMLTGFQSSKM